MPGGKSTQNNAGYGTFLAGVINPGPPGSRKDVPGCKDTLLGGLEEGPDVFTFADDQLAALADAGALNPVENASSIRTSNLSTAVEAACVEDTLYAYPLTADNGYFLYYNKANLLIMSRSRWKIILLSTDM